MEENEIRDTVYKIVGEQMGVQENTLTRDTHFINDLNADSLDTVELVMELEDEFQIAISDNEAQAIQTVGQAIDHIKEKLAVSAG